MTGYDTCLKDKMNYDDFIIKLNNHGCTRFEKYIASHLIEDYISKYNTKGGLNFNNWNVSFQSIIKKYTYSGNCDKTVMLINYLH